jgi:gliding motility-associated-like protein
MKRIVALLILTLGLAFGNQVKASHFAAGDIWYEYVSPLTYKVHVACYLDCNPGNAPYFFSQLCWSTASGCGVNGSTTLDISDLDPTDPLNDDTLDQLCAGVQNWCANATSIYPAFKYRHFVKTVTLSNTCADWVFTVADGARNSVIANGFANGNIGIIAELNNVARPINNSPVYTVKPIPYVCNLQPTVYQNGPLDPDLDSMITFSSTPMGGFGCNIPTPQAWGNTGTCAPYNANNPFPTVGCTYNVNAGTGAAFFTPNGNGNYVIAFKTEDWDVSVNPPVKVGSITRDVQIVVLACSSPPPVALDSLYNITGGFYAQVNGQDEITMCPGSQLCLNAKGWTQSTSNNLTSSANLNIFPAGTASYTTNNPGGALDTVVGQFCFTPSATATTQQWTLILTFTDSTCVPGLQPIVLKAYKTILLKVLPGVSGGGPYNYCPGSAPLQLQASGPGGITGWTWSVIPGQAGNPQANFSATNISNPTAMPSITMDVVVEGLPVLTGCPNKDTVTLNVFSSLSVNAGPDLSPCANDVVTINATTNRPIGTTLNDWTPGLYLSDSTTLITNSTPLSNVTYILKVIDGFGCIGFDTVNINLSGVRPIINAYPEKDTICKGEPVQLFANASPQPCGISQNPCSGPVTQKTIGTQNNNNSNLSPFYQDWNSGYRAQYLFKADELIQAGLSPGNISGLSFNVISAPANDSLQGFTIKIGCTQAQDLNTASGFVGGMTNVYTVNKFSASLGINQFNFPVSKHYYWDGKTNLIVEVCYNTPSFSSATAAPVRSTFTSFSSALVDQSTTGSGCALPGNGTSFNAISGNLRPNIKFSHCAATNFSYLWSPAGAFANNTLENPTVNAGYILGASQTFTVTVVSGAAGQCNGTQAITVVTDNSGSVNATVSNAHICEPGLVTLTGTPGAGTQPPVYNCGEENVVLNGSLSNWDIGSPVSVLATQFPFHFSDGIKLQYMFRAAELTALGYTKGRIDNIAINVLNKFSSQPYNNFKISMGCTAANQFAGTTGNYLNQGNMKEVYFAGSYSSIVGWNTFTLQKQFVWDGVSNLLIEFCYGGNSGFSADDVQMTQTTWNSAVGDYMYAPDGCSIPLTSNFFYYGFNAVQRPNTRMQVRGIVDKPFQYVWNPSLYVYDTTKGSTLAYVLQSTVYTVSLINRTGCKINDTVHVNVEKHNVVARPTDTTICRNDVVQLMAYGTGTGAPIAYNWFPNVGLTPVNDTSQFASPANSTTYFVERVDQFGCKDTAYMNVNINPGPAVTIVNGDSITVPYGTEVNLLSTGAWSYSWSPVWALNGSNTNNVLLQPKESGMYYVYGLDVNGCGNKDSIYVTVNPNNPVFLPSAFSPNGDGYNDIFRIQNFKFEKIQEFRVFSRFGEEVFSGKGNEGWDGTYRGAKLDMDTYTYLIRLAYPDGSVKVLKGDVIL